jgi:ferredoxin-type protein NapF
MVKFVPDKLDLSQFYRTNPRLGLRAGKRMKSLTKTMTSINTARRAFLRGSVAKQDLVQTRMPWAVAGFTAVCTRCDDCIKACEESVLVRADGGYPRVVFDNGGCTFCGACVRACRYGALDADLEQPWQLKASIGEDCLSARGITCRSCGDVCESHAIRFRLEVGGRAIPSLDTSLCNGCGSCIATCPTHVIQIQEAA